MPPSRLDSPESAVSAASIGPLGSPRVVAVLVLALASMFAAGVALRQPFSVAQPGYLSQVAAWSPSTPIADTFTPLAYPLLLAPAFRLGGTNGILAVQAAVYVGTVAVAFYLLLLLEVSPRIAGLGSLLILLHPEIFLSVPKIWDVGLSVLLFLLLVLLCVRVQRVGATPLLCLTLGIVFGVALFARPNYALLIPAIVYALWRAPARLSLVRAVSAGLIAALTFSLAGIAAHGRPFLPRNGPYNLYAGDNPYSGQSLLERLNGEPSIDVAFRAAHPDLIPADPGPDFYFSPTLEGVYTHDALSFVLHHPGEQMRLIAIKLFTLFRPDTKAHALGSVYGLVKAALALPALLFAIALLAPGRAALVRVDWMLLAFAAAYIVPFALTNSDPRFRTPLDALLLLFTVRLLLRGRRWSRTALI